MPSKPTEPRLSASIERLPNVLGSHQQSSSSTQSKNAESHGGLISIPANASRSAAALRRAAHLAKDDSTACATTEYAESSDVQRGSSDNYTSCSACGEAMQGAFVRAFGTVYHLSCFTCYDCGIVAANKYFPVDMNGTQHPLCERDYFRRLDLICASCSQALRGSYITACNKKYHVDHFTCSLCPQTIGEDDSYYEHNEEVYCRFHFSTRFATKCGGCTFAIIDQFVESERHGRIQPWHRNCYMINKYWNVILAPESSKTPTITSSNGKIEPEYADEERRETADTLRKKQVQMEQQVGRIWTVLFTYEEASAACISDLLCHVSNSQYREALKKAERFILHVEVIFGAIDDIEEYFVQLNIQGMSHVREARMLCRKTVDLFVLLQLKKGTARQTQELLALVTGLAHYLKILMRITIMGALRLERTYDVYGAVAGCLDKFDLLSLAGGDMGASRDFGTSASAATPRLSRNMTTTSTTYAYRSLSPDKAGDSLFLESARSGATSRPAAPLRASDSCARCGLTIEEECVRLDTYRRWHSQCLCCIICARAAAYAPSTAPVDSKAAVFGPKLSTKRAPPADVDAFVYDIDSVVEKHAPPTIVYCTKHAYGRCRGGFQNVTRLEQYTFLLNVALRRLYLVLKKRGVIPWPLVSTEETALVSDSSDPYHHLNDMNRLKSTHLGQEFTAFNNPEVDKEPLSQLALILSNAQLQADETMSLFPHRPDSVHSVPEDGLSRELLQSLTVEIRQHRQSGNRELLRVAIDDLDRAILLTDPMDGLYRSAIEHLRHWCRTSGELPTSCTVEDTVEFDIRRPLSSTALSDVYKGDYLGVQVAVKILRLHEDDRPQAQTSFRNEVVTWKCLRHPNIVPFLGVSNVSSVCLLSEWMSEGTLLAFLRRNPDEHRVRYIFHILQGLDFMHRLGVIHGDLKAVNVLVDEGRMARLADFGVATVLHNSTTAATTVTGKGVGGTVRWQAPELHGSFDSEDEDAACPSVRSDVYALAITIWELFTLLVPFPQVRADTGVLLRVLRGERPSKPMDCEGVGFSDTLWDVMQRGWNADAEMRPSLSEFATALGGTMEMPVYQADEPPPYAE